MSINNLPPELVEKIESLVRKTTIENSPINVCAEQCAQVAVDYAEEEKKHLYDTMQFLVENNNSLHKQRDELFEALKSKYDYLEEIAMLIPSDNWTEQFRTKWDSEMTNLEQLLKKHEDGKE